jgi:hypothetical protein
MGRGSCAEIPTVLAATILRFQCVERKEKERKDELHAFQSGEERTGKASEGLALEQLRFLFQDRNEFVRAESGVGGENERLKTIQEHVKTRTLHTPKDSAPPRVSIVQGFTPVPRGGVRHPPPPRVSIVQGFTPVPRGRVCHPPKRR